MPRVILPRSIPEYSISTCITSIPCYLFSMHRPKAVIFDLDETLAESFQPLKPEMIGRLNALLEIMPAAIMTGAGFERINAEMLSQMPNISSNFYIFPNSSSQCYLYENGIWRIEYNHLLTDDERARIRSAINECMQELDVIRNTQAYGTQIVDREAQIAFTVVGLEAPQEIKQGWDIDGSKRRIIVDALQSKLAGFDILIGGASTIDITRKDINKANGVEWLSRRLGFEPGEMLYVGDALYDGGNDAVVIKTGIQTRSVAGPADTAKIIDELLAACSA